MRIAALVLCLISALPVWAEKLRLISQTTLHSDHKNFGGFSALHVSDNGTKLLALSDRGHSLQADIDRKDGVVTGISNLKMRPILTSKGQPVQAWTMDAEGLAVSSGGRVYISFEHIHRVMAHSSVEAPARFLPKNPEFLFLQRNSSLEALAISPEGHLFAIPERSGRWTKPFPVYRLKNGQWDKKLSIPRRGKFLVSGADFGPDGRLYLLERQVKKPAGFSTRVRRFDVGQNGLENEVELLKTWFGKVDNSEGISVWRGPDGEIRVTLITDDNFRWFQKTELLEYKLAQ